MSAAVKVAELPPLAGELAARELSAAPAAVTGTWGAVVLSEFEPLAYAESAAQQLFSNVIEKEQENKGGSGTVFSAYRLRIYIFAIAIALLSLAAGPAHADPLYQYSFSFDALGAYSAASFSVDSTSLLLQFGVIADLDPTGSLNGWSPAEGIDVIETNGVGPIGFGSAASGTPTDSVIGFVFYPNSPVSAPGTYPSTGSAAREITGGSYQYTGGVLTVSEVSAAEPRTLELLLVVLGAFGLEALRRRKLSVISRQRSANG